MTSEPPLVGVPSYMPSPFASVWWHRFRGGLAADPELSDAELLGRYAIDADPDAFATLVHRHGPTVFGVCRRMLGDGPDADDAFQATFLVLTGFSPLSSAGRIRNPWINTEKFDNFKDVDGRPAVPYLWCS